MLDSEASPTYLGSLLEELVLSGLLGRFNAGEVRIVVNRDRDLGNIHHRGRCDHVRLVHAPQGDAVHLVWAYSRNLHPEREIITKARFINRECG